jgi:hypothetical protein
LADIFFCFYFLRIQMSPAQNNWTCGRFKKWINTVFQIKFKVWAGKLRGDSAARVCFLQVWGAVASWGALN